MRRGRGRLAVVAVCLACLLAGARALAACERDASRAAGRSSGPVPAAGSTAGSGTSTAPVAGSGSPAATTTRPTPTTTETTTLDGLPTAAELAAARSDVARLSTRALAGQLVVGGYSGRSPRSAASAVRRLGLGGLVVFAGNVPVADDAVVTTMRGVAAGTTAVLADQGRSWPPFLATDQEGGPVTRISRPATGFPGAMALGATGNPDLARQVGAASGAELRAMGFTAVLAPVADVTIGPRDPTIGVRSSGSDPATVALVAGGLARGYLDAGLVPVAKHFPGHGSLTTDSHVALPRQRASLSAMARRDLVPFQRLVEAGAPAVMTGHVLLQAVDQDRPATLSRPVTTGLLRQRLGFTGLVVTDGLGMGAVVGRYGSGTAAVLALRAGADVVLLPPNPDAAVAALMAAVGDGSLSRDRLVESATRMVATLRHVARPVPATSVVGSHSEVARSVADASVTQVSGRCGSSLVGRTISVTGALASDRDRFVAAARRAGLRTGGGTTVRLLGGGAYAAGAGVGSGSAAGRGDVLVALDVPYALADSPARVARLAAYGRTSATFDAVVAVLRGAQPARGHLPVAVGPWRLGTGCPP